MTLKTSTGFRNKVLVTGPVADIMDLGFLKLYSGTPPATADAAIGGGNTLLCTISINSTGTGLSMDTVAADGILPKPDADVWSGVNAAGGVATFYRHVAVGDTGALSTTEARIQGDISTAGADMNLTAGTTLTNGATQTINFYQIVLATL